MQVKYEPRWISAHDCWWEWSTTSSATGMIENSIPEKAIQMINHSKLSSNNKARLTVPQMLPGIQTKAAEFVFKSLGTNFPVTLMAVNEQLCFVFSWLSQEAQKIFWKEPLSDFQRRALGQFPARSIAYFNTSSCVFSYFGLKKILNSVLSLLKLPWW